jgi:hypothetical protein
MKSSWISRTLDCEGCATRHARSFPASVVGWVITPASARSEPEPEIPAGMAPSEVRPGCDSARADRIRQRRGETCALALRNKLRPRVEPLPLLGWVWVSIGVCPTERIDNLPCNGVDISASFACAGPDGMEDMIDGDGSIGREQGSAAVGRSIVLKSVSPDLAYAGVAGVKVKDT